MQLTPTGWVETPRETLYVHPPPEQWVGLEWIFVAALGQLEGALGLVAAAAWLKGGERGLTLKVSLPTTPPHPLSPVSLTITVG